MFKIETLILIAFIAWNLNVSQAKSFRVARNRTNLWEKEIFPLLDYVGTQYGMCTKNTSDVLEETRSKLSVIEALLTGMKGQLEVQQTQDLEKKLSSIEDLQKVIGYQLTEKFNEGEEHISQLETKLENHTETLQDIGNKIPQDLVKTLERLEKYHRNMQTTMITQQQAVETKMENLQRIILESGIKIPQDFVKTLETKIETLQQAVEKKLEGQQSSVVEIGNKIPQQIKEAVEKVEKLQTEINIKRETAQKMAEQDQKSMEIMKKALITMGNFEKIGTRYFYIEKKVKQNWNSARNTCREKGGYLASIKNKEELGKIDSKLGKTAHYWLGISDLEKEGEYVADSTGRKAKYLPWRSAQPDDYKKNEDCVHISSTEPIRKSLNDLPCTEKHFFICQLDNED